MKKLLVYNDLNQLNNVSKFNYDSFIIVFKLKINKDFAYYSIIINK